MMPYTQHLDACFDTAIGARGITEAAFDRAHEQAIAAATQVRHAHAAQAWPLLRLPEETCDLLSLTDIAGLIARQSRTVIVLGMGGSSLGGQTLTALARPDAQPRLVFPDNPDPHSFTALLAALDPLNTSIIAISKSGGTPETLAQLITLIDAFRARGLEDEIAPRVLAITQPGDSPLRTIAERWNIPILDHDPDLGGRYSVLSNVGLLPAALAGLDGGTVRAGAAAVLHQTLSDDQAAPIKGAAMLGALMAERGVTSHVLMPYASRLRLLAHWYRQLLAESLGKDGKGLMPIAALGPVDQHSMLQHFLDGPPDGLMTIIEAPVAGAGPAFADDLTDDPRLSYLAGHTMGDMVAAQVKGTLGALVEQDRPVRHMVLQSVDERALGALMMHFMLETIMLGFMLGVDPFGQPAVELGKKLTREYLQQKAP